MRGLVWTGELEFRQDIEPYAIQQNEVLVRIERAGLCHSDVSVMNGTYEFETPMVLGHEAAGVVEAVGSTVTSAAVGDHVVLTPLGNCGHCDACDRGRPTHCHATIGRMTRRF